jgi:hypothetical protein
VQEGKSVSQSARPSVCVGEGKPKVVGKYAPSTRRFWPAGARTKQRWEKRRERGR